MTEKFGIPLDTPETRGEFEYSAPPLPISKEGEELANKLKDLKETVQAAEVREEVFSLHHKRDIQEKYGARFENVKCVLIPLEGVLYISRSNEIVATPQAVESFQKLRESGLKILLIANTWLKSKARILTLLANLGFELKENELFTSADCCKRFMKTHDLQHPFILTSDEVQKDFAGYETEDPLSFDSVVLGLPSTMIDYRLMTKAFSILKQGQPLLVLQSEYSSKAVGSCRIITSGPFSEALTYLLDAKRYMLAMPSPGFYLAACKWAGFPSKDCVIIGDSAADHVKIPKSQLCMRAILIKTGRYLSGDECRYCDVHPDATVDNFYKAVKYLLAASGTDPDKEKDEEEEAARNSKWQTEHDDFYTRLNAYAEDDCKKNGRKFCLPKLPSIIW